MRLFLGVLELLDDGGGESHLFSLACLLTDVEIISEVGSPADAGTRACVPACFYGVCSHNLLCVRACVCVCVCRECRGVCFLFHFDFPTTFLCRDALQLVLDMFLQKFRKWKCLLFEEREVFSAHHVSKGRTKEN